MGNAVFLQCAQHGDPALGQGGQGRWILDVVVDEILEARCVDPLHLEYGMPVAAHANALFEKLKPGGIRTPGGSEVAADRRVPFLMVGKIAKEASHSPLA